MDNSKISISKVFDHEPKAVDLNNYIKILPKDLLETIFTFLDNSTQLGRVAAVSLYWEKLSSSDAVWKEISKTVPKRVRTISNELLKDQLKAYMELCRQSVDDAIAYNDKLRSRPFQHYGCNFFDIAFIEYLKSGEVQLKEKSEAITKWLDERVIQGCGERFTLLEHTVQLASISGFEEDLHLLLKLGADPNRRNLDDTNETAFFNLFRHNNKYRLRVVKKLIDAGLNISIKNNNGETPLEYSGVEKEEIEEVKKYAEEKADLVRK